MWLIYVIVNFLQIEDMEDQLVFKKEVMIDDDEGFGYQDLKKVWKEKNGVKGGDEWSYFCES